MLIECTLKRDGPISVAIGNETYDFAPDEFGRRVAEVWREDHQEMFLSSGAAHLYRQADPDPRAAGGLPAEAASPAAESPTNPGLDPARFADPDPPPLSPQAERMVGLGGALSPRTQPAPLNDDDLAPGKTRRTRLFATARELGIPITGMMTNAEVERLIVDKRGNPNA